MQPRQDLLNREMAFQANRIDRKTNDPEIGRGERSRVLALISFSR